ncbi:MAG: hypothetical protein HYY52_05820 [Candidatus Melainabacteria bacterium]|nr:hypothetical protein [Candidatus Melainabacteria bacterium]
MSKKTKTLKKNKFGSYAFNQSNIPFPELDNSKIQPPDPGFEVSDTKKLFPPKAELTQEEKACEFVNHYKKIQRVIIGSFYTGGSGAYSKGFLDAIYKGIIPSKQ